MSRTFLMPALFALVLAVSPARAAEPIGPYRPPRPVERTLSNGLRVAVFPDARLPLVQVQVLIPAGSGSDPGDQAGVARLTALMLRSGTIARDAQTFAAAIDRLGKRFDVDASRDYVSVGAAFLARDFERGIELVGDAVTQPVFPTEELELLKQQTLAAIAQFRQDPVGLVEEQLWRAAFPAHPYSWQPFGAGPTVRSITRDQVMAFYSEHYRPAGATLGIAGDITPERAFALAEEWFGRWQGRGASSSPEVPPAPRNERPIVRLVDLPDVRACAIRVAVLAPARTEPDQMPIAVAAALIGNGPNSRLSELAASGRLRREARASYTALRSGGILTFSAVARPESVGATLEVIREQLQRLGTETPSTGEIDALRQYSRATLPFGFETLGGVVGSWSSRALYGTDGLPSDDERIAAVTPAEVGEASRRWLAAERLVVVVAGPAAAFRGQLEAFGNVEVVGPGEVKRSAPSESEAAPPTAAQIARARSLIKLAVAAHGGAVRLAKVKDSRLEAEATLYVGPRQVRGRMVQVRKDPDKMIFSTSFEGMATEQTLNGRRAWSTSGAEPKAQHMDSLGLVGMRSGFSSDVIHLLRSLSAPGAKVASRGTEAIDGLAHDVIEVGEGADRRVIYLDAKSHRVAGMEQRELGPDGEALVARRVFRDHRMVQGILWPFIEERLFNGERMMAMRVERVALDIGIGDELFESKDVELPPPSR